LNRKLILAFVGGVVVASLAAFVAGRLSAPPVTTPVKVEIPEPAKFVPEKAADLPVPAAETKPGPAPLVPAADVKPNVKTPVKPSAKPLTAPKAQAAKMDPPPAASSPDSAAPAQPLGASDPVSVASAVPPPAPPAEQSAPVAAPGPVEEPPKVLRPDAMEVKRAREERTPQTVTIPAGTALHVRLNQTLSSANQENGDGFSSTLDEPLVVGGYVIAEKGSRVDGRIVDVARSGRVSGRASLSIRLATLHTSDRQRVAILTEDFVQEAKGSAGKDAARVGTGAVLGAALGAIFGGGKGAAIGAAAGGAAGAGRVLTTRGNPAEIPVETRISFRLRDSITLTERLN
jgi:hypothetical protein